MSAHNSAPTSDLLKQTLRTVIVLVSACVLFVGALSGAAVAITSRAFASPSGSGATSEPSSASEAPSVAKAKTDLTPAKKPQSI
jgi:hypothetical protein